MAPPAGLRGGIVAAPIYRDRELRMIETAESGGSMAGAAPLARLGLRLLDLSLFIWLFLMTGAVFILLIGGPGTEELSAKTEATLRLFTLPALVLAPVVLALRWRELSALAVGMPVLTALVLWVWCSIFWSIDPGLSARRALAFTTSTVISAYIAVAWPVPVMIRRLTWLCLFLLALTIAFAVALPSYAFMTLDHALRGVFTHKNGQGQVLAITALVCAVAFRHRLLSRWLLGPALFAVAVLAVPVHSATALVLLLLLCGAQLLLAILALPRGAAAVTLLAIAAGVVVLVLCGILFAAPIAHAFGRNLTLTGRTELWAYVLREISFRPLLGYGYNVFFDQPEVQHYALAALGWDIPNAHNGYLEIWLGLGIVGLALLLVVHLGALMRALRGLGQPGALAAEFAFLWLAAHLVRNLTEADFLKQTGLSWVLTVLALVLVSRPRRLPASLPEAMPDVQARGNGRLQVLAR